MRELKLARPLAVAALVVMTGAIVTSCASSSQSVAASVVPTPTSSANPNDVVNQFIAALNDRDCDSYFAIADPSYSSGLKVTDCTSFKALANSVKSTTATITSSEVEGTTATVHVDAQTTYLDDTVHDDTGLFDLKLENGKWMLSGGN